MSQPMVSETFSHCGPISVWHYFVDHPQYECLAYANLLQVVTHHGTDLVKDLGLLCRNKILRPVGIMVASGTRSVFFISVLPVTFGPI